MLRPIYTFISLLLFTSTCWAGKPNVLFIAVDDLRPSIGCFGDTLAITPNMDRLANGGTVFERAYCQQAVCSPSRSSLLTGRRPDTTKVYDLVTHFRTALPDVVTLPQHFKNNGYHVQGIGKIFHNGYNDEPSWSVPWEGSKGRGFGPRGQEVLAKAKEKAKAEGKDITKVRGLPFEAPEVEDDYLSDGWIAKRGEELLAQRKKEDKPFFLAIGFAKPHLPFVAPKKYWDMHNADKLPTAPHPNKPVNAPAYATTNSGELLAYEGVPNNTEKMTPEMRKQLVHGYYAATSYMDAQLGKLLDKLNELKLEENTIVILWGDHGWHLNDHAQWCKHTNFEVATRAALILRVPGQKAPGQRTKALVEFVDIYPTLADLCQLPNPLGVEGISFKPLIDEPAKPWKKAAFSQYPRGSKETGPLMGYAIRTERYRMVEWRNKASGKPVSYELYDHQIDAGENVNIAEKPEMKAVKEELVKQLAAGWPAAKPQ